MASCWVFFHAHPDDEALLTAGTMARLAAAGVRVVLVVATAGERGLTGDVRDGCAAANLGVVRLREQRASAAVLGCARVVCLGYADSGSVRGVRAGRGSFAAAKVQDAARGLAEILRAESAEVLTIYDPAGGYGHPDHVQVHRVGRAAAALAGTSRLVLLGAGLVCRMPGVSFDVAALSAGYVARSEITHRVDVRRYAGSSVGRWRRMPASARVGRPDACWTCWHGCRCRCSGCSSARSGMWTAATRDVPFRWPRGRADGVGSREEPVLPGRVGLAVTSVGPAVGLLGVVLPRLLGIGWREIAQALGRVPLGAGVLLVLGWLAGLWAYTFVVTATLPALSTARAFAMTAAGAAMANLLPLGGAVGALLTFAMARSWGHDRASVVASALVSNTCNVLARLLLPAVGLAALLAVGSPPNTAVAAAAAIGATACGVGAAGLAGALCSQTVAAWLGRLLDSAARLLPRDARPLPGRAGDGLRREILDTVRGRWAQLTLAMAATLALQGALFAACLHVSGADPVLPAVLAAFAVSRALTIAVLTPNGVGISETATAATLVALGVPPVPAAAAVLLFGLITHLFEIVLGALTALGWWSSRRLHVPR